MPSVFEPAFDKEIIKGFFIEGESALFQMIGLHLHSVDLGTQFMNGLTQEKKVVTLLLLLPLAEGSLELEVVLVERAGTLRNQLLFKQTEFQYASAALILRQLLWLFQRLDARRELLVEVIELLDVCEAHLLHQGRLGLQRCRVKDDALLDELKRSLDLHVTFH